MFTRRSSTKGLLLLVVLLAGCFAKKPAPLAPQRFPIPGFSYVPPDVYKLWFYEAHRCALLLRQLMADTATFQVDTLAVNIEAITWIAVPTERHDRTFLGMITASGDSVFVWGMTAATNDTIWLAVPLIESRVDVKHEAQHIFVRSHGESRIGQHGLPWGFCELL